MPRSGALGIPNQVLKKQNGSSPMEPFSFGNFLGFAVWKDCKNLRRKRKDNIRGV